MTRLKKNIDELAEIAWRAFRSKLLETDSDTAWSEIPEESREAWRAAARAIAAASRGITGRRA